MAILCCGLIQSQVNGTGDCTTVQPSICVHSQRLTAELFQVAWLLDRFEKAMKTCRLD